ncbi:MAG: hypothetical protein H7249_11925 [Chitinophagaceae bacterium]|nr:hypothetical protein [Oligoflexus sp.]
MTLARKDVFQASKILIDFLRDFTSLSEQQLLSTKKMLEGIVSQVMTSMMQVSDEATLKKNSAQDVLVRDVVSGNFIASPTSAVEKKEADDPFASQMHKAILESKLLRSSGSLSKHLEAISMLDHNLQKVLADVIGAVSVDDVIAQRLDHVIQSLQTLQKALAYFLNDYQKECTPDRVKHLRNRVLTEVYLSYSSEEEKEIFHKIFGLPKVNSKAS